MLHWHGNGAAAAAAAPPPPPPQCSFSFNLFSSVSGKPAAEESGASSSSSVDCTLTLGTPYTRNNLSACSSSSSASVSNSLCWDILPQQATESAVDGLTPSVGGSCAINLINGDPFLLARRCANCDTTSTPLWRNGPRGPKSLCNACGIRYKKEERRAAASSAAACEGISYGAYTRAVKGSPASSLYSGDADEQRELYLPWRLNVVGDRPAGIYQYQ